MRRNKSLNEREDAFRTGWSDDTLDLLSNIFFSTFLLQQQLSAVFWA